jgi:uncharacterized membrane protein YbhN (UPF0104 family)
MSFRSIFRFLREKVNWHFVGIIISVVLITIAAVVLYNILKDLDPRQVVAALRDKPPHALVLAGIFVAAGYFTLTFYDYFALHSIDRGDVPYRIAALAGFTSYSIGHNIGFSVLAGGAVRYRIYSLSGLTVIDVAKICVIAGLTFWLGNVAFLGIGLVIEPEAVVAIDTLPENINRAIGAAALIGLVAYVLWVSLAKRTIGIGHGEWTVTLPGGRLTLVQIGLGVIDLSCCAAAMYVLMPNSPQIDFISLSVIFVSATLLGFASSAPGGLGVFDAAMLLALMNFDRHSTGRFGAESVLGALLIFRLFYYVIPFTISLAIIGVREFILDLKPVAENIRKQIGDTPPGEVSRRPAKTSRKKS